MDDKESRFRRSPKISNLRQSIGAQRERRAKSSFTDEHVSASTSSDWMAVKKSASLKSERTRITIHSDAAVAEDIRLEEESSQSGQPQQFLRKGQEATSPPRRRTAEGPVVKAGASFEIKSNRGQRVGSESSVSESQPPCSYESGSGSESASGSAAPLELSEWNNSRIEQDKGKPAVISNSDSTVSDAFPGVRLQKIIQPEGDSVEKEKKKKKKDKNEKEKAPKRLFLRSPSKSRTMKEADSGCRNVVEEERSRAKKYDPFYHLLHCCVTGDLAMCSYLIRQLGADPQRIVDEKVMRENVEGGGTGLFQIGDTPCTVASRFQNDRTSNYIREYIHGLPDDSRKEAKFYTICLCNIELQSLLQIPEKVFRDNISIDGKLLEELKSLPDVPESRREIETLAVCTSLGEIYIDFHKMSGLRKQDLLIQEAMRLPGRGVTVHPRRKWHLSSHKNVFVGSEAVTWIARKLHISREEAVMVGRQWQQMGDFASVNGQEFKDNDSLYRFKVKGSKSKQKEREREKEDVLVAKGSGIGIAEGVVVVSSQDELTIMLEDAPPNNSIDYARNIHVMKSLRLSNLKLSYSSAGFLCHKIAAARQLEHLEILNINVEDPVAGTQDPCLIYRLLAPIVISTNTLKDLAIWHLGTITKDLEDLVMHMALRNFYTVNFSVEFITVSKDGNASILQTLEPHMRRLKDTAITVRSSNSSVRLVMTEGHHTVRMLGRKLSTIDIPHFENNIFCTNLVHLHLDDNEITSLPVSLCNLVNMRTLSLANNLVENIIPQLGTLLSLTEINVSNNNLSEIPSSFLLLSNLTKLNVKQNRINKIPAGICFLSKLTSLQLGGNPLDQSKIPSSLLDSTNTLLEHIRHTVMSSVSNETHGKIVFVGKGNSGKTTLLKALRLIDTNGKLRQKDVKRLKRQNVATDGVEVSSWQVRSSSSCGVQLPAGMGVTPNIFINTYDFAGQSLYYSTHHYFMTPQSLYVVVLSLAEPFDQSYLDYWMEAIKYTSNEAPVFVVATKVDKCSLPPDELRQMLNALMMRLKQKYPNIVRLSVVCSINGQGVKLLLNHIIGSIIKASWSRYILPHNYLAFLDKLNAYREATENPTIIWADMEALASGCGIRDQDLVSVINFTCQSGRYLKTGAMHEDVRTLIVLDVPWLTKLLCTLVTLQHRFVKNGLLKMSHMQLLLRSFLSEHLQPYVLELLELFEVAYGLPDDENTARLVKFLKKSNFPEADQTGNEKYLLIPYLLPDLDGNQDLLQSWRGEDAGDDTNITTQLYSRVYEFSFLPTGLFHRLVVRLLACDVWRPLLVWKHGVVLTACPFTSTGEAVHPRSGFLDLAKHDSLLNRVLFCSMTHSQMRQWVDESTTEQAEQQGSPRSPSTDLLAHPATPKLRVREHKTGSNLKNEVRESNAEDEHLKELSLPQSESASSLQLQEIASASTSSCETDVGSTPQDHASETVERSPKKSAVPGKTASTANDETSTSGNEVARMFLSFERNRLTVRVTGPAAMYTLLYCTQELESLIASSYCPSPTIYIPCPSCVVSESSGFHQRSAEEMKNEEGEEEEEELDQYFEEEVEFSVDDEDLTTTTTMTESISTDDSQLTTIQLQHKKMEIECHAAVRLSRIFDGGRQKIPQSLCSFSFANVESEAVRSDRVTAAIVFREYDPDDQNYCIKFLSGFSTGQILVWKTKKKDKFKKLVYEEKLDCPTMATGDISKAPVFDIHLALDRNVMCVVYANGINVCWCTKTHKFLGFTSPKVSPGGHRSNSKTTLVTCSCLDGEGQMLWCGYSDGVFVGYQMEREGSSGPVLFEVKSHCRFRSELYPYMSCAVVSKERVFAAHGNCLHEFLLTSTGNAVMSEWGINVDGADFTDIVVPFRGKRQKRVWSGDKNGKVTAWSTDKGEGSPVFTLPPNSDNGPVHLLGWEKYVIGTWQSRSQPFIYIWDTDTSLLVAKIKHDLFHIKTMSITSEGCICCSSYEGEVGVWWYCGFDQSLQSKSLLEWDLDNAEKSNQTSIDSIRISLAKRSNGDLFNLALQYGIQNPSKLKKKELLQLIAEAMHDTNVNALKFGEMKSFALKNSRNELVKTLKHQQKHQSQTQLSHLRRSPLGFTRTSSVARDRSFLRSKASSPPPMASSTLNSLQPVMGLEGFGNGLDQNEEESGMGALDFLRTVEQNDAVEDSTGATNLMGYILTAPKLRKNEGSSDEDESSDEEEEGEADSNESRVVVKQLEEKGGQYNWRFTEAQVEVMVGHFISVSMTPSQEQLQELHDKVGHEGSDGANISKNMIALWFKSAKNDLGISIDVGNVPLQKSGKKKNKNVPVIPQAHSDPMEPTCIEAPLPLDSFFSLEVLSMQCKARKPFVKCGYCATNIRMDRVIPDITSTCFNLENFNMKEVQEMEEFAEGGFAKIFRGKYRGRKVAVKVIKDEEQNNITFADFRKESWIMSVARHPFVLSLIAASSEPLAIMMEYMTLGDLRTHMVANDLPLKQRLRIANHIALGMRYLHNQKPAIIHMDLKSLNVLLTETDGIGLIAKVSDFGKSHYLSLGSQVHSTSLKIENCLWTAPEVLGCNIISRNADVYSYGIILWEIMTRRLPFDDCPWMNILESKIIEGSRPSIPDSVPSSLRDLMCACWDGRPEKRPDFGEIINCMYAVVSEVFGKEVLFSEIVGPVGAGKAQSGRRQTLRRG